MLSQEAQKSLLVQPLGSNRSVHVRRLRHSTKDLGH